MHANAMICSGKCRKKLKKILKLIKIKRDVPKAGLAVVGVPEQ
jgi:hypothetical protein